MDGVVLTENMREMELYVRGKKFFDPVVFLKDV
jgi:hypothetical protein